MRWNMSYRSPFSDLAKLYEAYGGTYHQFTPKPEVAEIKELDPEVAEKKKLKDFFFGPTYQMWCRKCGQRGKRFGDIVSCNKDGMWDAKTGKEV